jgi:hypothetical protein
LLLLFSKSFVSGTRVEIVSCCVSCIWLIRWSICVNRESKKRLDVCVSRVVVRKQGVRSVKEGAGMSMPSKKHERQNCGWRDGGQKGSLDDDYTVQNRKVGKLVQYEMAFSPLLLLSKLPPTMHFPLLKVDVLDSHESAAVAHILISRSRGPKSCMLHDSQS